MASRHSRGPWKAEWSKSRGIPVLYIRNGRRDPIALVYSSEADADLMAASPQMVAYIRRKAATGDQEAIALLASIEGAA